MPQQLSGGQRQRVAIGRALLASPRLLLMDEPLAALDAQARAEILPCLDQLHRELAIPVVYVSHTVDEIARLADYLVRLDAGRVVWQGAMATGGLAQLGAAPRYAATVLANDAGRLLLEINHPQLASLAQPGTVFQVRLD
jgi:molybdate transport system ATP-binding protein